MFRSLLPLALALPLAAFGSTLIGNPVANVVLVDGNGVYVHSIVGYKCAGGSTTLPIGATFDELDVDTVTFDEAEYCDVVVRLKWTPTSSLEPVTVTGFTTLDLIASGSVLDIELDQSAETASIN